MNKSYNGMYGKKKNKGCFIVMILFALFIIGIIFSINAAMNYEDERFGSVINSTEYALNSPEEVISKLGEPSEISEYNFNSVSGSYIEGTLYEYIEKNMEFLFVDNKLVEINVYSNYLDNGNIITFNGKTDLFKIFGLKENDSSWYQKIDNNVAIRYSGTGVVKEFWVPDTSDDTFYVAKIRFDMSYFE